MESKRTYRDTAGREISLPKEVYYRCLWVVRDSRRLVMLVDAHVKGEDAARSGDPGAEAPAVMVSDETARRAAEELACIDRALRKVPEVYRKDLLDNIIDKKPFGDFAHPNTWKRWKLVFLYELARELRLI